MLNSEWQTAKEYKDLTYKKRNGVARIAFNRPEVRNAFRPQTVDELYTALEHARITPDVGVVIGDRTPGINGAGQAAAAGQVASGVAVAVGAGLLHNRFDEGPQA
jgi:1,4-dihydroxy-2-naphthoyl-CoA synthase